MSNFKFNLICATIVVMLMWTAIIALEIEIKDLREELFFARKQRDADIEWVERELKRVKEKPAVGRTQSYGLYFPSQSAGQAIYYDPSTQIHAFYMNPDGTFSATKPKEKKCRK